jgi:hypothetical protein
MSKSITGLFAGFGRKPDPAAPADPAATAADPAATPAATTVGATATPPAEVTTAAASPAPAVPAAAPAVAAADAPRQAVLADRARIAAILQHGGPDKVEAAASLALNTDLSAEQACGVLDSLPAAAAAPKGTLAALMADRNPKVGVAPGGGGPESEEAWAKRVAGYARQEAAA